MKGTEIIRTLVALITALLLMPPAADAATPTGVSFQTSDTDLQRLFDAAEAKAAANIVQFTPTMKALVEGGGYGNVWIETQPMGGEMYAKRNLEVALNNQLLFLLASARRWPAARHGRFRRHRPQARLGQEAARRLCLAARTWRGRRLRDVSGLLFPGPGVADVFLG